MIESELLDLIQQGENLPVDSLIVLSRLRERRRLGTTDLALAIQKPESTTRGILEKLTEAGMIEAQGANRGRTYTLSAKVYQQTGQKAAYVRQAGFDPIQQEQMVLNYLAKHTEIKRGDVMELCQATKDQAYKLLLRLKKSEKIEQIGSRKGTIYKLVR